MTLTRSNSMPCEGADRGEEWVRFRLPHFCSLSALLITSSISDTLATLQYSVTAEINYPACVMSGDTPRICYPRPDQTSEQT